MKLDGKPLQNSCSSLFSLRRGSEEPLTLRLEPLSLGFHQRLQSRSIVLPQPPVKIARDSQGKPMRDPQGQVLTMHDRQDPSYRVALEQYHQCVAVLSLVEALRGEPRVQFDAVAPTTNSPDDWRKYAQQIYQELELAGFTAGDLVQLCREVGRLSNLIDDHLQAARQNFSSAMIPTPD
ncbi:hypothetical protein SH661x_004007 [Planctomicrobium sp. SH661]|uniref:hypothetical protein n=1 Tax=Planctomicrobium sp. SH661 TaxID=3448124 RepID=UPI003F5C284C